MTFDFLFLPSESYAHVLQTDKNIGAVLHMDPEDDPIAGEPSSLFFEIKDKEGKFSPAACNCRFTVTENGTKIFTQSLSSDTTTPGDGLSVIYTFPKKDIYEIQIAGTPTKPNEFQPFSLSYTVRVERINRANITDTSNTFSLHWIHFLLIGGGFILFLILLVRQKMQENKQETSKGGEIKK